MVATLTTPPRSSRTTRTPWSSPPSRLMSRPSSPSSPWTQTKYWTVSSPSGPEGRGEWTPSSRRGQTQGRAWTSTGFYPRDWLAPRGLWSWSTPSSTRLGTIKVCRGQSCQVWVVTVQAPPLRTSPPPTGPAWWAAAVSPPSRRTWTAWRPWWTAGPAPRRASAPWAPVTPWRRWTRWCTAASRSSRPGRPTCPRTSTCWATTAPAWSPARRTRPGPGAGRFTLTRRSKSASQSYTSSSPGSPGTPKVAFLPELSLTYCWMFVPRRLADHRADGDDQAEGGGGHVPRPRPPLPRHGRLRQEVPLCAEIFIPGWFTSALRPETIKSPNLSSLFRCCCPCPPPPPARRRRRCSAPPSGPSGSPAAASATPRLWAGRKGRTSVSTITTPSSESN